MSITNPPYVLASASHSAELFRDAYQSVIGTGGVIGLTDLAVTAETPAAMKVKVAEGQCAVPGSLGATGPFPSGLTQQGTYYTYVSASVALTIAASNPTNPRIDTICASIQDAEYSGSNNQALLQVSTGTPTPGATLTNLSGAGAVPASSIVLAHVLVPANATSIVTADLRDARPFVAFGNPLRGVPTCRMYRSGAYTNPSVTITRCPFDTISWNIGGGVVTLGATASYTVAVAGWYQVSVGWGRIAKTTQNAMQALIYRTGSYESVGSLARCVDTVTSNMVSVASDILQCAVGNEIAGYFSDFGGGPADSQSAMCFMSIALVSTSS